MTHAGVLATILSGLEPSVAIVLACIPLLRPLFGDKSRKLRENHSGYAHYASDSGSGLYSKKGGIMVDREFQVLDEDNDRNSSQVELKPVGMQKTTNAEL